MVHPSKLRTIGSQRLHQLDGIKDARRSREIFRSGQNTYSEWSWRRGCVAFRREKFIEFGGPDGGDGGRGGDVYVVAKTALNTLIDFRYRQHFKAKSGGQGEGSNRSGAKGADVEFAVPVGTQILDEDNEEILYDLTREGERICLARGGDGGFGNAHYKSATNRTPRRHGVGWPGEEKSLWLRLKLIADAGLVGLPNAGKSTFLATTTRAKPKIADYPFTTLAPQLGVVGVDEREFVLADLPGLIEGAHEGVGLGDRFLGHIERCKVILHLIDGTSENVVEDWRVIRGELTSYGNGLAEKPEILALSKCDALNADEINDKIAELNAARKTQTSQAILPQIYALSSVSGQSVRIVLQSLAATIEAAKLSEAADENNHPTAYEPAL